MSGISERPPVHLQLPRLLLHLAAWIILCRILKDIVGPAWAVAAFPASVVAGFLASRLKLRVLPSLAVIAILPWTVRFCIAAVSGFTAAGLPVRFDNAWLLTAPLLYFTAVSFYIGVRYPLCGYVEAFLLGGLSIFAVNRFNLWESSLSIPGADTFNLIAAALILILVAGVFVAARYSSLLGLSGNVRPTDRLRNRFSSTVYILAAVVFLALLLAAGNRIRREHSLQSGGGLLANELFRFDFNDVLSLEPEIALNAELTMLYREDGPPTVRYLRRFTLSGWEERKGFFREGENETDYPNQENPPSIAGGLPKAAKTWPEGDYNARSIVEQEYYLIALDPQSMFALNFPVSVEPWTIWDDASFTRAYAVTSMESIAGPWELIDSTTQNLSASRMDYYLSGGDDPYFKQLAADITGNLDSDWERAQAVERWFQENFYYSLRPGTAPDGDQLGWFLKESRRGYCSYFAFAMARICRAAGIPARVAVGFLTDPDTSTLGFTPVRSDQAHAWVEVWFDDYGWISFDPTSGTMAPGEEYPVEFIPPDEWLSLIEEVLTRSGEVSAVIADESQGTTDEGPFWDRAWGLIRNRPALVWMFAGLVILVAWFPGRILPGIPRLRYRLSSSSRRRVMGYWRLTAAFFARCGNAPRPGETALGWAGRIEDSGVGGMVLFTRIYLKAEYSLDFSVKDKEDAFRAGKVVRTARRRLPFLRRVQGIIGPGWKGGFPW